MATHDYPNVIALESQRLSTIVDSAQRDVNVGVTGIEVGHRHPVESGAKISLYSANKCLRQRFQVDAFTKFRRNDDLENPLVTLTLPSIQCSGQMDSLTTGS